MKLILAEKPSVAKRFANALNANQDDGFFKNDEYIITFCIGHLLELYEPEDYNEDYKKWNISDLPIIPEKFKHKPNQKTKKQLNIIKRLLKRKDIELVINACDAGREGELIFRLVIGYCKYKGNIDRFWSSVALTDKVIFKELNNLKDISEYNKYYLAGIYRQIADWIVGMNYSRYFSCSFNNNFSFGRVQMAILSLICERQNEINNFIPENYFKLEGIFKKNKKLFKAFYNINNKDNFKNKDELDILLSNLSEVKTGKIYSVKKENNKKPPPKLLNLTGLQKECNKKYGFSAKKTFDIAQNLYENHKCLSYPRTPSRAMGENDVDFVKSIINKLSSNSLISNIKNELVSNKNRRVFNNKELEDHHALVPLSKIPDKTNDYEKMVYNVVLKSFIAAFCEDYEYQSIKVVIDVNDNIFIANGNVEKVKGWKKIYITAEKGKESEVLPDLNEGDIVDIDRLEIKELITKPPDLFTESSLLSAMEHPNKFKKNKSDDYNFSRDFGVGTPATRASIIETLIRRKYVFRKRKNLNPLEKGLFLYNNVCKLPNIINYTDVTITAEWEYKLKTEPIKFLVELKAFVNKNIEKLKTHKLNSFDNKKSITKGPLTVNRGSLGCCPCCGYDMREGKKNYYCSGYTEGCKVSISKKILKTQITKKMVDQLLTNQQTEEINFTSNKNGKKFKAKLVIKEKSVEFEFAK